MLNILFALFLFGMLLSLCVKAFMRALNDQEPLSVKETALLVALAIGCLTALGAGVNAVYHVPLFFY